MGVLEILDIFLWWMVDTWPEPTYAENIRVPPPPPLGEECSLDFIFLLGEASPFGFLVGEFFQIDETRKGWPLGSRLWCLTVFHFPIRHWYPGSGVVLDSIDFWSLHPYLLFSDKRESESIYSCNHRKVFLYNWYKPLYVS